MEGRDAAAREAYVTLVAGYGAPSDAGWLLAQIADVERRPPPAKTVEGLLATPFPKSCRPQGADSPARSRSVHIATPESGSAPLARYRNPGKRARRSLRSRSRFAPAEPRYSEPPGR